VDEPAAVAAIPEPLSDGSGNPLLERLDRSDGQRLLALPAELVWASTWMAEAKRSAPWSASCSSTRTCC
jgi:hypothetical protein